MTEMEARDLKRRYGRQLLALDEVSGVGLTLAGQGDSTTPARADYVLAVFLTGPETPDLQAHLSDLLDGNEFVTVFAGKFRPHASSQSVI